MVWTRRLLANGVGALLERLGLGGAALRLVQFCEPFEPFGKIVMIRTPRLLADGKGALQERLGLGIAPLALVQFRQTFERFGEFVDGTFQLPELGAAVIVFER